MATKNLYCDYDINGNVLKNVRLERLASNPIAKGVGHIYFNTTINDIKIYDGTKWKITGNDSLQSLSDTSFTSFKPTDVPQYLVWNGISWLPSKLNLRLGDLSDVKGGGVNGQVLTIENGAWSAKTLSGITVDNWKDNAQLITTGGSATANLQAHDDLKWDGAHLLVKSQSTTQGAVIKLDGKSGPADSTYALIGFASGTGGAFFANATIGLRNPTTRPHQGGYQTNEMVFETTKMGDATKTTAMTISQSGCVVIRPRATAQTHTETELFVNGAIGQEYTTITADAALTPTDAVILCNTSANPITYNLGNPNVSSDGKHIQIKLYRGGAGVGNNLTISGNMYLRGGNKTTLVLSTDGDSADFMCMQINSTYYWCSMGNH